jgi:hypothetical protein
VLAPTVMGIYDEELDYSMDPMEEAQMWNFPARSGFLENLIPLVSPPCHSNDVPSLRGFSDFLSSTQALPNQQALVSALGFGLNVGVGVGPRSREIKIDYIGLEPQPWLLAQFPLQTYSTLTPPLLCVQGSDRVSFPGVGSSEAQAPIYASQIFPPLISGFT